MKVSDKMYKWLTLLVLSQNNLIDFNAVRLFNQIYLITFDES